MLNRAVYVLDDIFTEDEVAKKKVATEHIKELIKVVSGYPPFVHRTTRTTSNALVSAFLEHHGGLTNAQKEVLKYRTAAVKGALKDLYSILHPE